MRTVFELPPEVREEFLRTAIEFQGDYSRRPEQFLRKMRQNIGSVAGLNPFGLDERGLERRNPLIVALGDSVTAGHFEWVIPLEELGERFREAQEERGSGASEGEAASEEGAEIQHPELPGPVEITDARVVYHERFRQMLIDEFEQTSVSMVNAGIAGDTIFGMEARLSRDVVSLQPDLVLLNGALNWPQVLGDNRLFQEALLRVVRRIKAETDADVILMTPNMDAPNPLFPGESTLPERVQMIRQMASGEGTCLSDAYAIWEAMVKKGYEPGRLLANGINHPDKTGHEVYAIELMKLCCRQEG